MGATAEFRWLRKIEVSSFSGVRNKKLPFKLGVFVFVILVNAFPTSVKFSDV